MTQEQKIMYSYIEDSTLVNGIPFFNDHYIEKMLQDYKAILIENWSRNQCKEIEWKEPEQYPESTC